MQPLLRLGSREFLSGIAQGAHDTKRLWYKADGINPLSDAATGGNTNSGLLMAGASGTSISGIVDTPLALTMDFSAAVSACLVLGGSGHFYSMQIDSPSTSSPTPGSDSFTDLRSGTPISNARAGLKVLALKTGSSHAFYWQQGQIGKATQNAYLGISTYPTGWTDNWKTSSDDVETDDARSTHQFGDAIYYSNGGYIGKVYDDGTSTPAHDGHALDLPANFKCLGLTDDGTYLVIAACENYVRYGSIAKTKILFWDTFSASWNREYDLPEAYLSGLVTIGGVPYALGKFSVWETPYQGARRILSRAPGIFQSQQSGNRAQSIFASSLVWGGSTPSGNKAIHTLGSLDDMMPSTYLTPIKLGSSNVTLVDGQVYPGYILVGTANNDINAYPLAGGTPQTGLTAQTVYIPLKQPTDIERIDLVFGEPLASGDAVSVSAQTDEDTTAVSFDSASYASDGAIRRKKCYGSLFAEDQFSLTLSFTGGAPKIKEVLVYGQERDL